MAIADAPNSVFAPSISPRTRMIVRKIFPSRAARAVVLAHRSPLPLGHIRPPPLPLPLAGTRLFQSAVFNGLYSWHEFLDCRSPQNATTYLAIFWRPEPHGVVLPFLPCYALPVRPHNAASSCSARPVAQGGACPPQAGPRSPAAFSLISSVGTTKTKKTL